MTMSNTNFEQMNEAYEGPEPSLDELYSDIEKVPQFSDSVKLLLVDYSKPYSNLMSIFRGLLKKKEISMRMFSITTKVLDENASNYMAWVVRRQCLDELKEINNNDELLWLDGMMVINQKNYQIWHHRKLLIDKLNDCSHEKEILNQVFDDEPKNFHAWTHRIWMIRRFNNIEGEFDFIENMLNDDIFNNSVWTYRYFLVNYIDNSKCSDDKVKEEVNYALEKIKKEPSNECPYNYIRGFLKNYKKKFEDFKQIEQELNTLLKDDSKKDPKMSHLYGLLLDIYEEKGDKTKFNEIVEILSKIDYIRKKYYNWRKENFK